jgi:ATP-dependent DNA helicase DinG
VTVSIDDASKASAPEVADAWNHRTTESSLDLAAAFAALRTLPGFQERSGQRRMAEEVAAAFAAEQHLFVEAGTGVGKTFAYLIPAALSGKRVVISTATKALQEQLIEKDVPRLHALLATLRREIKVSVMKGLGNYLCLRRLSELGFDDPNLAGFLDWVGMTETGDVAELSDPKLVASFPQVATSSETRIGASCKHYDRCFVTQMRRRAEAAELIIVNHHLFFADLALRSRPEGLFASVIPPYHHVIFDEAHQVESIVTEFFGEEISSAKVQVVLRDARRLLPDAISTCDTALAACDMIFACFDTEPSGKRSLETADFERLHAKASAQLFTFEQAMTALRLRADAEGGEACAMLATRVQNLTSTLARVEQVAYGTPDAHAWIEERARSRVLGVSPIAVAPILRENLFGRVPGIVCTSATLSAFGKMSSLRDRLGADEAIGVREAWVESPFRYQEQALLYVPADLPDPSPSKVEDALIERTVALLQASDGGAFVLCTSLRSMRQIYEALIPKVRGRLLIQGNGSKQEMLDRFREVRNAVLVATVSFWEGVDVPGDALRLVILEKTPFPVPTDPLFARRSLELERQGRSAFTELSCVEASLRMKQGFGRLIRSETDRGVVAILDSRLHRKSYGRKLIADLPPARRTRDLEVTCAFLREVAAAPAP